MTDANKDSTHSTPTINPRIHWTLLKDWEEMLDMNLIDYFEAVTGQPDMEAAALYLPEAPPDNVADIIVFPEVILKYRNNQNSVSRKYRKYATMFTHSLLHELCHHEEVEKELALEHPNENVHTLIDLWIRDKVLAPSDAHATYDPHLLEYRVCQTITKNLKNDS